MANSKHSDMALEESIFDNMKVGLLILDSKKNVKKLNRQAEKLLELRGVDVAGQNLKNVFQSEEIYQAFTAAPISGDSQEIEILDKKNRRSFLQIRKTELKDGITIFVLTDISRLKVLEKIRRDFVANVSHELRTPVTSIMGFVETLLDGAVDQPKECRRFLSIIERQSQRLISIIEDLLMLARLEGNEGKAEVDLETLRVESSLKRTIGFSEHQALEKNILIKLNCPESITYSADWSLLEQAIANLIDNALKYSGNDTEVVVSAANVGENLHISVKDQGPGIPIKNLGRIFERFYRIDKTRSRSLGGTGLGLAIVKHVAHIHRGSVDVKSSEGEGSEFTIVLPLK